MFRKRLLIWMMCAVLLLGLISLPIQVQAVHNLEKDMIDQIQTYLGEHTAQLTFQYENLVTGERIGWNSDQPESAASTIKLPLGLYFAEKLYSGDVVLQKQLTYQGYHYYGGSGVIKNAPIGTKYTIEQLMKLMIVSSDNIAFIMLREYAGRGAFIDYMRGLGAQYTYPNGENLTSSEDLVLFLKHLYQLQKNNPFAGKLVQWLQQTEYNEAIPKGTKADVAHKVGMIPMYNISNDAGIIFDEHPYVLAVMTNDYSYESSVKVIAHVTSIIDQLHQQHRDAYKSLPGEEWIVNGEVFPFNVPIQKLIDIWDGFSNWNEI